jgi:N-acetylglucosaminyldiphosphoundecaprenol N-acetyl-beta-D-mannosaminyltransferase
LDSKSSEGGIRRPAIEPPAIHRIGQMNFIGGYEKPKREPVLNIEIDPLNEAEAIARILSWYRQGRTEVMVNPNLDCLITLEERPALRFIYDDADLVLADGWPVALWGRLHGRNIHHIAGSDIIWPLCRAAADAGQSVFLLGTTFESLTTAARRIAQAIPTLIFAGVYSPPYGFERSDAEENRVLEIVNSCQPAIVLIALGAPKQELWAHRVKQAINANALICVGASIDFISGRTRRAPQTLRRLRLEWFWRMMTEPRRLGPRYMKIIRKLPGLLRRYG